MTAQAFDALRPSAFAIAYRTLGSASEARTWAGRASCAPTGPLASASRTPASSPPGPAATWRSISPVRGLARAARGARDRLLRGRRGGDLHGLEAALVEDQSLVSVSFSLHVACSPLSWLVHVNVAEPLTF